MKTIELQIIALHASLRQCHLSKILSSSSHLCIPTGDCLSTRCLYVMCQRRSPFLWMVARELNHH